MPEQRNLLLAFMLALVVVLGWSYFIQAPKLQQEQARQQLVAEQQKAATPSPQTPGAPQAVAPASAVLPRAQALAQQSAGRVGVDTPTLDGSINLTGGRFDDLKLRNYRETPDQKSAEIELLSPRAAEHPYFAEFGWIPGPESAGAKTPGADTEWKQTQGNKLAPGKDIELSYDNGEGQVFTRHVSVDENYMFTIRDTVNNNASLPVSLSAYALVYRSNLPVAPHYWVVHEGFIGAFNNVAEYDTYAALADKNQMKKFDSQGGWVGITDKYWMGAAIPPQSEDITATFMAYDTAGTKAYRSDYVTRTHVVPPSGSQTLVEHFFAGAKVVDIVDNYTNALHIQRFDRAVDWGWFFPLTKWMFQALDFLYKYVGNFGIAILIFTVFVKALFFPLANTSYRAMSKMKKLQPEMERLRERFKEDKAQQQQALMQLYQKEKVNPLAGCLPMVIQVPVFFSLYKVLLVTIDMRQAPFFGWVKDLSAADPTNLFNLFGLIPWDPSHLPLFGPFLVLGVFPIIMGITMWLQTNLNPPPADPVQQKLFGFMPLIFTFMMANFPVGLVIYWSWNNALSIIQQVVIMKSTGTPIDFIDRLRGMWGRIKHGEAPEKPAGPPD
ncbi:MAG TPA: membrane protein insertase YidC [Micropepsaceae bacterium]|nr:membrane protein insertase YidC [Micropepsaceae bacterium]